MKDTDKKIAISVEGVSKTFLIPHERTNSVKSVFVNIFRFKKRNYEKYHVLKDINFEIEKGDFFGIVGRNGSGKSTLLKLLAGIYAADKGNIKINGSLTPFIELGVGFNGELSGRENVFLNGALLGFSRKETESMYDEIVEFSELEKFMDQKLKNYSSGMLVRLAFSIAVKAHSDILLLDEVLAVGDAAFQRKCFDYFMSLKKEKRTVILVTHDMGAVSQYCNKAIMINDGKIIEQGSAEKVAQAYHKFFAQAASRDGKDADNNQDRWGTGDAKVNDAQAIDVRTGKSKNIFDEDDHYISIEVGYTAKADIEKPIYGITVFDAEGQRAFASNTLWSKIHTEDLKINDSVRVTWKIPNVFNNGSFTISPAIADQTGATMYDSWDKAAKFDIRKKVQNISYINALHEIEIK